MYKIIFIDDEILIREAVLKNTPWKEAGFEISGTAGNGKEAIELINKVHPHVVLTDIRMPVMDGLELAKYIHENYPDIKVMILSGHDEFEYAKRALKYGVSEYILKPITAEELKEELIKIRQKLDESISEREKVLKIQRAYEENMPFLRDLYLNKLLDRNGFFGDWREQFSHFKITYLGGFTSVCMVALEDASAFFLRYPDTQRDLVDFAIYNISHEICENRESIYCLRNMNDKTIMIFTAGTEEALQRLIRDIGERIIYELARCMDIKVSIVIGKNVTDPVEWCLSYDNAKQAEEFRFLLDDCTFVYGLDFVPSHAVGVGRTVKTPVWTERLVLLIKTNQTAEIAKACAELFKEIKSNRPDRKSVYVHVQNLVLSIIITLEENDLLTREEYEKDVAFINHLNEYEHLKDVEEAFLKLCLSLAEGIAGNRESDNKKLAVLALDYIEKNYHNPDISLNAVCEYLSVSMSYFSTIFKAHTGETYVEAVTRVRVDKAKHLLSTTNMKNYEIAEAIGITDPHYFSTIFKKQTGMTPGEYVKSVRK